MMKKKKKTTLQPPFSDKYGYSASMKLAISSSMFLCLLQALEELDSFKVSKQSLLRIHICVFKQQGNSKR